MLEKKEFWAEGNFKFLTNKSKGKGGTGQGGGPLEEGFAAFGKIMETR